MTRRSIIVGILGRGKAGTIRGLSTAGLSEAGGHTASSLPLLDSARKRQSQQQINAVGLDARGADDIFRVEVNGGKRSHCVSVMD